MPSEKEIGHKTPFISRDEMQEIQSKFMDSVDILMTLKGEKGDKEVIDGLLVNQMKSFMDYLLVSHVKEELDNPSCVFSLLSYVSTLSSRSPTLFNTFFLKRTQPYYMTENCLYFALFI